MFFKSVIQRNGNDCYELRKPLSKDLVSAVLFSKLDLFSFSFDAKEINWDLVSEVSSVQKIQSSSSMQSSSERSSLQRYVGFTTTFKIIGSWCIMT